jgi:hypothetical protein
MENSMLLLLFKITHAVFGGISLYAGGTTCISVFSMRPFERSSVIFLRCALIASATGLLLNMHSIRFAQLIAMFMVYTAGVAVLARQRFHLKQTWNFVFISSLIAIFLCDILECVHHVLTWLTVL